MSDEITDLNQVFENAPDRPPEGQEEDDGRLRRMSGTVSHTFCAYDGFSAGVFRPTKGYDFKFAGQFRAVVGDPVCLIGRWIDHETYGRQFEVLFVEEDLPNTQDGLVKYLSDNPEFRGIGEKTARKLVDLLDSGETMSSLIATRPEALYESDVPNDVVTKLIDTWRSLAHENQARAYLAGWGLTHRQIQSLILDLGPDRAVEVVRDEPYSLIRRVRGLGFKTVDRLARGNGIALDDPGRTQAVVDHVLRENTKKGHIWMDRDLLVGDAQELICDGRLLAHDLAPRALAKLSAEERVVVQDQTVAPAYFHLAEKFLWGEFRGAGDRMNDEERPTLPVNCGLLGRQVEAFEKAIMSPLSVISGGAGTGKTLTLSWITRYLQQRGQNVVLCAPTGKAAYRMRETFEVTFGMDVKASTIHKLLGYNGEEFKVEDVDADTLIVDETSMVDSSLLYELLRRTRSRVILVGDHNQLPSVGPGSVLRDLIEYRLAPVTVLDKVYRQAGVIKENSVALLDGEVRPSAEDEKSRWDFIDASQDADSLRTRVIRMYIKDLPEQYGYNPQTDIQVLTPIHDGPLGTKMLNKYAQESVHRRQIHHDFVEGDKVIQTRNDYKLGEDGIMNGTQGVVLERKDPNVVVRFGGYGIKQQDLELEPEQLQNIRLAYALTAHKCQGSEFKCVIVVVPRGRFFDRNWLYTSTTRAQQHVVLVSDDRAAQRMALREGDSYRNTLLGLWANQQPSRQTEPGEAFHAV